jgi:hypothetical protein
VGIERSQAEKSSLRVTCQRLQAVCLLSMMGLSFGKHLPRLGYYLPVLCIQKLWCYPIAMMFRISEDLSSLFICRLDTEVFKSPKGPKSQKTDRAWFPESP